MTNSLQPAYRETPRDLQSSGTNDRTAPLSDGTMSGIQASADMGVIKPSIPSTTSAIRRTEHARAECDIASNNTGPIYPQEITAADLLLGMPNASADHASGNTGHIATGVLEGTIDPQKITAADLLLGGSDQPTSSSARHEVESLATQAQALGVTVDQSEFQKIADEWRLPDDSCEQPTITVEGIVREAIKREVISSSGAIPFDELTKIAKELGADFSPDEFERQVVEALQLIALTKLYNS